MRGGSFIYLYMDAESVSVFNKLIEVYNIESYLRQIGKQEAANEVLIYIRELETHQRRIETIGKRISGVLQATEWCASSDWGPEEIDKEYWKLMGINAP